MRICLPSTSVRGEWRVVGRLAVSKGVGSVNVRHVVDGTNPAPVGMVNIHKYRVICVLYIPDGAGFILPSTRFVEPFHESEEC